jgi:hypothetical protein
MGKYTIITNGQQYQQRKHYSKAEEVLDLNHRTYFPQKAFPLEKLPESNKTRRSMTYTSSSAIYLCHSVF